MSRQTQFWNREYKRGEYIALSTEPAEDLVKFCRWLERETKRQYLNPIARSLDIGTGNGRNLVFLAKEYGMRGVGIDISETGIKEAKKLAEGLPLEFFVQPMQKPLPVPDNTVTIALDMMSSHYLKAAERDALRGEILRVLKPGGWLFFKSFLADEDIHTKRLLKENAADEEGAYIHPEIGVYEYTWTEDGAREFFEPYFEIHKITKSHRHIIKGKAGKRRTLSMYLQKLG
jgi:SAM-dependent methyltransferase